jgi:hypothetical protein
MAPILYWECRLEVAGELRDKLLKTWKSIKTSTPGDPQNAT